MSDVHILAIDLAKRSFQVCAADRGGAVLFNRTVSRAKLMQMLNEHEPCIVAMEACATQRTSVDSPIPRSSATSRCVRPLVCTSRTASASNSCVNRLFCIMEFLD